MDVVKKIKKDSEEHKTSNIVNIIKGSAISIAISIVALIIFSVILTNTQLTEETIKPVIMIITVISILTGSVISVSKIEKKGILNGALVGLIYVLTIYLISSMVNSNFTFNLSSIIIIFLSIIAGIIGGIIGVNMKK